MVKKTFLFVVLLTTTLFAQSRGTPRQLRVKIDANGYLVATAAAQTNPITTVTFNNARLAVDANGYLQVIIAGGSSSVTTSTANTFCLDTTNKDIYIARVGSNDLGIFTNATNCASGTLRFDASSTLTTNANPFLNTVTSQSTSNQSIQVFAGVTASRTYYTTSLFKNNIVLANAVPRATGNANYFRYAPTDTDASGIQRFANLNYFESGGTQNFSSTIISSFNRIVNYGTGTVPSVFGGYFDAFNGHAGEQATTGGNVSNLYGIQASVFQQSLNSSVTNEYGVLASISNDYAVAVTNAYGVNSSVTLSNATPVTNAYAYYAGTVQGTNKYSFYASDATAPSIFTGGVGIGTGVPTTVVPLFVQESNAHTQIQYENTRVTAGDYIDYIVKSGTTTSGMGASNQNYGAGPLGSNRSWLEANSISGSGWDYAVNAANGNHRFYTAGEAAANERFRIDTNVSLVNNAALLWITDNNADIGASGATRPRNLYLASSIKQIGGITTAGVVGSPAIVANGRVTAQSAANASISTFTVGASDGSFEVSGNMNVTAAMALVTTLTVNYTDESNTSRVMILPVQQLSGSFIAAGAITAIGAWETPVMHIRAKAATSITILTSTGTFTGVTYTAEGIIKQTS